MAQLAELSGGVHTATVPVDKSIEKKGNDLFLISAKEGSPVLTWLPVARVESLVTVELTKRPRADLPSARRYP